MHRRIHPIILAAGQGSRLDPHRVKACVELHGQTFLASILAALDNARLPTPTVVIGADRERVIAAHASAQVHWVTNTRWAESHMATSLRLAIEAPHHRLGRADELLVWPIDAPCVAPHTLVTICSTPCTLARVPTHGGQRGHPLLLAEPAWRAIAAAVHPHLRALLDHHAADVELVEVADPAILDNLNTPQQLAQARARKP